jgi:predicted nucleic acid-binding protein
MNYLLDTNIIIYYLQQQFPQKAMEFVDTVLVMSKPCFSVITEIELLCWKTATQEDIQLIQNFIEDSIVIELKKSVKIKTVEIRKKQSLKLPDAIIAATALVEYLTLITHNVADFRKIAGLRLHNPWDFV